MGAEEFASTSTAAAAP